MSDDKWHHPDHYSDRAKEYAKLIRAAETDIFINRALPKLTNVAKLCGYALTLHGSKIRDLDLVAVPWIDDATPIDRLVEALVNVIGDETGWKCLPDASKYSDKPHGRTAVIITASFNMHIDLSIMPKLT
jgi:hypothetical protein